MFAVNGPVKFKYEVFFLNIQSELMGVICYIVKSNAMIYVNVNFVQGIIKVHSKGPFFTQ